MLGKPNKMKISLIFSYTFLGKTIMVWISDSLSQMATETVLVYHFLWFIYSYGAYFKNPKLYLMVHLANRTRIQNCTNSFMFLAINSSKLHCSGRTTPWSRFGIKRLKTEFSTHLPRHYWAEKYIIFWEYIKFILVPLTWSIVGPTMNLISVSHYSC